MHACTWSARVTNGDDLYTKKVLIFSVNLKIFVCGPLYNENFGKSFLCVLKRNYSPNGTFIVSMVSARHYNESVS